MSDTAVTESLLVGARLLWYIGVLVVIGASTCRLLGMSTAAGAAALKVRCAAIGLVGAAVLLAGVLFRLYAQTYAYFGLDEGVTRELLIEVATGLPPWSRGWLFQAGAAAASAGALAVARVAPRAGWPLAHFAALALAATAPMTGHAVAQDQWPRLPLVLQAGHVLGAGMWLGGLVVLLAGTRSAAAAGMAPLVTRFSPVALTGAGLLTVTGAATVVLYLGTTLEPWSTAYGSTLLAKMTAFAGVVVAGFVNWRWMRPRMGQGGGVEALRRTATLELGLATLVLAATAWLVGLPQP